MKFIKPVCLHARDEIEAFLHRQPFVHLYELGDLDDFFWSYTIWYALKDSDSIRQIVLLYTGAELPVLLGFSEDGDEMSKLLRSILHLLPKRFYAHLSSNTVAVFAQDYQIHSHGTFYKMALTNPSCLDKVATYSVEQLSHSDVHDLEALYQISYPGNWFDPRMLETGHYYGVRQGSALVSVAGVHVYSPQYRVATLGNVTTHPDFRHQGLATKVCAKLCQSLLGSVDYIGLNVKADNTGAISCYQRLGFEKIAVYGEYTLDLTTILS
ncbi:GNAT family N-acetyltransferase [Mastigocladopsis repens]|uniref:GNAT family N-acetyltransferase n=1 Tax=Mastigocladopsis repens TaxID=221287 RepID=UPI0002F8C773|nr:GNAT family N-acetyltransferase [Mastigocladopsis repens]